MDEAETSLLIRSLAKYIGKDGLIKLVQQSLVGHTFELAFADPNGKDYFQKLVNYGYALICHDQAYRYRRGPI